MAERKPTKLEKRFVKEYLKDRNGTQAVLRAGYNYTDQSAATHAGRLLRRVEISKLINIGEQKMSERSEITADRVIAEIAKIAFSDATGLTHDDGSFKKISELTEAQRASISEIQTAETEGRNGLTIFKRIKTWDKMKALEMLSKHLGLLQDRVKIEGLEQQSPEQLDYEIKRLMADKTEDIIEGEMIEGD